MRLLFTLAWRNIWRNSRRSLLTILAVAFATMLSVVMSGILIGMVEVNIKNVCNTFTGYVQIQRVGYQRNPSLQLALLYDDSVRALVAGIPEIRGFSPRIQAQGLVSRGDQSLGAMIIGIVPATERHVSDFHNRMSEGSFLLSDSSYDIVVGYKLLRNLNAKVGEEVVILAQGYDGSLGNMKYRIAGTIKTGSPEFDGMTILMGLSSMNELIGMIGRVHTIAISLDDLESVGAVKAELSRRFPDPKIAVLSWEGIMPDFKKHIEMDQARTAIFQWILVAIVAFGILNTVLMSVTERFREFGVILSMGMSNGKLVILVLVETLFITWVGLLAGNLVGAGINYYLIIHPIAIEGLDRLREEFGFVMEIQSSLRSSIFVDSSLAVIVLSLLACLYPLHRVRRLEPLKGLRFT